MTDTTSEILTITPKDQQNPVSDPGKAARQRSPIRYIEGLQKGQELMRQDDAAEKLSKKRKLQPLQRPLQKLVQQLKDDIQADFDQSAEQNPQKRRLKRKLLDSIQRD